MIQILPTLWFPTMIVKILRQFNLLNMKPCTEAPLIIQHAKVRARVYVRVKAFKYEAYAKKGRNIFFQDQLNKDLLIELFGTTIHHLFISLLTL